MANLTLRLPLELKDKVKEALLELGFSERYVPNTFWSLTDGKTYLNLYTSGVLLFQGEGAKEVFGLVSSMIGMPKGVMVGCDEAGKGEVFGPLVLCCSVIKPEYYTRVLSVSPTDSKRLEDKKLLKKAELLEGFVEHYCRVVEPLELNILYEEIKNYNRLLDRFYRELLEALFEKYPDAEFYIDAYSHTNPFGSKVVFKTKGEENLAVAVSSILARAKYLKWLYEKNLPKGSDLSLARKVPKERAKELLKVFFLEG
ncbi:MAG: ribonuclease HIII [Aquificota bacterium]|nr:MAG: ribonuclease HIII [Aquificota bacterium]